MEQVPEVVFGTAQLFGLTDEAISRQVLESAWDAGLRRFDTAPSYGGGRGEAELGAFLGRRRGACLVTTKVGLAPAMGTRSGGRQLVRLARTLLPEAVTQRLRRASQARAGGLFDPPSVTSALEDSLRRLGGRIDRYLLHEVTPGDVTDELLELLRSAVDRGDVGAVGVATGNDATGAAVAAGHGLFTVAQYAVGPLDPPVAVGPGVTTRVGHGLLGAGGRQLDAVSELVESGSLAASWREATAGTGFEGPGGVARALLARRPPGVTDVLVATTRPARVPETRAAVAAGPLPPAVHVLGRRLAAGAAVLRPGPA